MMKSTFKAFTMAEVLTVLLIIGFIAVLMIPSLYSSVTDQRALAMLRKLYASYSVNIETVVNEVACSSISCTRKYGNEDDADEPEEHNGAFANTKYFEIAMECSDCFNNAILPWSTDIPEENAAEPAAPEDEVAEPHGYSAYLLKNGASAAIYDYKGNCTHTESNVRNNNNDIDLCGIIVFDVDGPKGANSPGKDRFAFYITDEPVDGSFLLPIGYSNNDQNNNNSPFNVDGTINSYLGVSPDCVPGELMGYNCTAKVLTSGWKKNY